MFYDDLKMTGHLTIAVNDAVVQEVPNLVVTDGKEYVASRMKDTQKMRCLTWLSALTLLLPLPVTLL